MSDSALLVIPARAGSMGVYRKNVRSVAGHPLISYGLSKARYLQGTLGINNGLNLFIVVATDDEEIRARAELDGDVYTGLAVVDRPSVSAHETIDEMLAQVVDRVAVGDIPATVGWPTEWEWIAVHQLTSPTLRLQSMADMLTEFDANPEIDSMATMVIDTSLRWTESGPLATKRTNRQYADDATFQYRETGGLHVVRDYPREDGWYGADCLMIGENHKPFILPHDEAIDIDTPTDLAAAELVLARPLIKILTSGNSEMGSGHLRRADGLAAALAPYAEVTVEFLTTSDEMRGIVGERYRGINRTPQTLGRLWSHSHCVIVDCLNMADKVLPEYVARYPGKTILIESDGCGDAVCVNGLYDWPEQFSGPEWIDIRDEFRSMGGYFSLAEDCRRVLVSFGGSDPARLSVAVADAILALDLGLDVSIIDPPFNPIGIDEEIDDRIVVLTDPSMVTEMCEHDLMITGRGRTSYEAATVGIPTISFAVNSREKERNTVPVGVFGPESTEATSLDPLGPDFVANVQAVIRDVVPILLPVEVRSAMSYTERAGVDGRGLDRIRDLVLGAAKDQKQFDEMGEPNV